MITAEMECAGMVAQIEPVSVAAGAIVTACIAAAAYVVVRRMRGGQDVSGTINRKLTRAACDVELDLKQLQLEDATSQLAQGWNKIVEIATFAQNQQQDAQLLEQVQKTLSSYQTKWASEIVEWMPHALLTVDEHWVVTYANKSASKILGKADENLAGVALSDLLDGDVGSVPARKGTRMDRTFHLKDGGIEVRLKSVDHVEDGSAGDLALFLQDFTQQQEIERERSQFLYHITHELRTPLTNIRAYAETLSEGVLEDEEMLRECYNVIVGETQRLSRLVEDILSLSQLEAGSAKLTRDDVQTARLIRQVVEDMQAQADDKGIELVLSLPAKVPDLRADKDRLAVVLTNLVGNAIKYTAARGRVEIGCEEVEKTLRISVKDTGMGIPPDEQEKVFEKFYRAQDERVYDMPGTGLGLALAMETAQAHGGTIELESEVGVGSTFTVVLPVERLAAVAT